MNLYYRHWRCSYQHNIMSIPNSFYYICSYMFIRLTISIFNNTIFSSNKTIKVFVEMIGSFEIIPWFCTFPKILIKLFFILVFDFNNFIFIHLYKQCFIPSPFSQHSISSNQNRRSLLKISLDYIIFLYTHIRYRTVVGFLHELGC